MIKKIKESVKYWIIQAIQNNYKDEIVRQCKKEIFKSIINIESNKVLANVYGEKMYCYLDSKISPHIFSELFERREVKFVKYFLEEGDIFVDVGANIGLFSIVAAPVVGEKGDVVSFEPTPKLYKRLNQNKNVNGYSNIHTYELGLYSTDGHETINVSNEGRNAWNSLEKTNMRGSYQEKEIETTTIDNFIVKNSCVERAKLIKIDVEGAEFDIIKGGEKLFASKEAPTLLIEFADRNTGPNRSCKKLHDLLVRLGYSLYELGQSPGEIIPHTPQKKYKNSINLIASKDINHLNGTK